MVHEIDDRGQQILNEDIKRILIDRDITTIKQEQLECSQKRSCELISELYAL